MAFCSSPIHIWCSNWISKARNRNRVETPDLTDMCGLASPALLVASPRAFVRFEDDTRYPSWPPLNPRVILANREFYNTRFSTRKYRLPMGSVIDSPLFSLYRLYEWIMSGHTLHMRNEMEVIWWARWPISNIPDPGEQGDPERYAVLACIPTLLVESFNHRNGLGMRRAEPHAGLSIEERLRWAETPPVVEEVPFWAESVAPLETTLHIPLGTSNYVDVISMDDPEASVAFKEKNILIRRPPIHFI